MYGVKSPNSHLFCILPFDQPQKPHPAKKNIDQPQKPHPAKKNKLKT